MLRKTKEGEERQILVFCGVMKGGLQVAQGNMPPLGLGPHANRPASRHAVMQKGIAAGLSSEVPDHMFDPFKKGLHRPRSPHMGG